MTHHLALRPEFAELVDPEAPVVKIQGGFAFTEGPIWHPGEGFLLFSDMPNDVRRRWDPLGGVQEVLRPANKCNGMTYDAELRLVVCEHASSSLVRFDSNGRRQVLASHFEGKELNSPNDVVVAGDGSIYFTDPWYGRMAVIGVERPRELGWQGVFRWRPTDRGGELSLVVNRYEFAMPNGLCFSPDETLLYINDTERALIKVYQVDEGGGLRRGRFFASGIRSATEPGVPDGMKCDARGNVWVTAPGGVWIYSPKGELLGKLRVPELVANLHWGGRDFLSLFLCASTSVYRVETRIGPRQEPFMAAWGRAVAHDAKASSASASARANDAFALEPARCALILQDMQNDVVADGGAFAASGAPDHARRQNVIANLARLAEVCRAKGVMVIHVWFVVEPGAPGLTLNAPLFEGVVDNKALVKGSWGAEPVAALKPHPGDFVVEKMRMSAFEGTRLETILKAQGRDILINTGAWTNMSVEHTARTAADKGYFVVVPEDGCSTMNADWHRASVDYGLQNVAAVTDVEGVIGALG
ncbi:MAG: isochorismatase family protein [Candidatus Competibacterales bacterium]